MPRPEPIRWGQIVGIAGVVAVLDQASKMIVSVWIGGDAIDRRWELAGRIVAFEYVENTGAAFGILAGRVWLLSVLALVVAATFILTLRNQLRHHLPVRLGVALLIGGALGNLLDRVRMGHVVDFIAVGNWPKFNLADSAITVGLIVMAREMFREPNDPEVQSTNESAPDIHERPSIGI